MINLPNNVKEEYKSFNREIDVYGNLYLANKTLVDGEYVIDYTIFPLYDDCKILSFTINEKTDVYYTSLPYNTMTIEVNNENGYFTDYDPNSIIEQLNEDCYVILYMSVNNTGYERIMCMNFDKISYSDYKKAKLNFYSLIALTEKFNIKDKNGQFSQAIWRYDDFYDYLKNNYNIELETDHSYFYPHSTRIMSRLYDSYNYTNLRDMIINFGTEELGNVHGAEALITTSSYYNSLRYKEIKNIAQETIESNLQLEKAIIKKEDTYKGGKYNYVETDQYITSQELYNITLRLTLQSSRDTLVITDNRYKLSDITINDITSSSNVSVSIGPLSQVINKALPLIIEGNTGDVYDITINKSNIPVKENISVISWPMGNVSDASKILERETISTVGQGAYIFLFIKKPIKSYVEAKIMGLPYLEIGDTIEIVQDNRNVKIFITEINTTYNDGLLQTIKGYELDWTHKVTGVYENIYGDLNNWE